MRATLHEIHARMSEAGEYLIFCVGDSITEGARASGDEQTYTAVLTRRLAARYPTRTVLRYDGHSHDGPDGEVLPIDRYTGPVCVQKGEEGKLTVIRCGIGGNSTRRMLRRRADFVGKEFEGRLGDLFLIHVGINDSIQKVEDKYAAPELYAKHLHELLDSIAEGNPDADAVLMTPTWFDHGTSYESCLDPYAAAMKAVAAARGVPVIDLHRLWLDHLVIGGEQYGQGDWLNGDRCHPSDKGHTALGEEIARCLLC